jgi:acyl-coenzyme A thioesterase PaaI-like protein
MTANPNAGPEFLARASEILHDKFAPWVQELALTVESCNPIVLRLSNRPEISRIGGIICGQAIMAAADTAMVLAVSEALGDFVDMATVTMATSFLAAASGEDLLVRVELTKLGKSMAFGDARLSGASSGVLCAQANMTYSIRRA